MAKAHPGFKSVQNSIAKKEGVSKERAGAILAASSRGASKAAKKANPRLKRVHGGSQLISTTSMKGQALTQARPSNMATKNSFTNGSDAKPAGCPNQDKSLSESRSHNLAAKKDFCHGSQRSDNLKLKKNPNQAIIPQDK